MKFACFTASLLAVALQDMGAMALRIHNDDAQENLPEQHHHAQMLSDAYGEGYAAAEVDIANLLTLEADLNAETNEVTPESGKAAKTEVDEVLANFEDNSIEG